MHGLAVRRLAIVAALVLAAGLVVGFLPYSANAAPCGSPFVPTADPFEADLQDTWSDAADIAAAADVGSHQDACADRRDVRRTAAIALVGVGAAGLAWAWYGRAKGRSPRGRQAAALR